MKNRFSSHRLFGAAEGRLERILNAFARWRAALLLTAFVLIFHSADALAQPYAYVTNTNSENVSVINIRTNTVVATVPVGRSAGSVAITPNGGFAYVTEYFLNNVSVINTSTNTVVASVPVGNRPRDIAFTPDGSFAYVTNELGGKISVINTTTNTVIADVPVGGGPRGIAITPNGSFAYVANSSTRNVSVIDLASNTVIATVGVGVEPRSVATSPDGSFAYVVTYFQQLLSTINTSTNTVVASVVAGSRPVDVAITPDGRFAYVTLNNAASVSVIDLESNTVTTTVPVGDSPYGVAITPDGNFAYVTVAGTDSVSVISTATNAVVANILVGDGPIGIAITPPLPEIDVQHNGVSISNGDDTPDASDGTDFGNAAVSGFVSRTFTIANTGSLDLHLTGPLPRVQISGPNASDFTVIAPPASSISSDGTTTFTINFHPSETGSRTATLSIPNDDGDESPYEFAIQGLGIAPPPSRLFLAERSITLTQATVEGALHSNKDITFKTGKNNTYTGDVTAVGKIVIQAKNTIVGNVAAGGTISNSGTVTGSINPSTAVNPESLPELSFTAGGGNVSVPKDVVMQLPPGSYGNIAVLKAGKLQLSSGEYFMNKLTLAEQAILEVNVGAAEVEINVVSSLSFGKKSQVLILPGGESATEQLTFKLLSGGEVKILESAEVLGTIIAPSATVSLASNSRFKGLIIANVININKGVVASAHGSSTALPKVMAFDFEEAETENLEVASIPEQFELGQNYPNPFNPSTVISFQLPVNSEVTLGIYNIAGQLVRKLVAGEMNAGQHSFTWDATNDRGARVASGVYFYVLKAGEFSAQKKLMLMK